MARTLRLTREQWKRQSLPLAPANDGRPRTRAECVDVPRPCPYVSCSHHLFLDVNRRTGTVKLHPTYAEPGDMPADRSCALDVAEDGIERTLEDVAEAMGVAKQRAEQIEKQALKKLYRAAKMVVRG